MTRSAPAAKAPVAAPGIRARMRAIRAFSFPLSALPVLVAAAVVQPFPEWRWKVLIASVLGVLLLHSAGNLLNDYFDFRSGVDRRFKDDDGRPGRLLVRGELTLRDVLIEAGVCLVLCVPVSAYLVWQCGPGLLWFGAAALLGLYVYTGPPFALKYHMLGEALIFAVFGPVLTVGAGYAQTGRIEWPLLLLSVPIGMATTAVVLGNNIRDMDEDRSAGVRTLAHRLRKGSWVAYYAGILLPPLATVGLVAAGVVRWGAAACLFALVPAVFLIRRTIRAHRMPDIDARTAQYATVFLLLVWFGLMLT